MAAQTQPQAAADRELVTRYQAKLEAEVRRVREDAQRAVEEFKSSFAPPNDEQIERLLYPELAEFAMELGGRRFAVRELPALAEKKFLRLVEQKLPALMSEILAFDQHLGDAAGDTEAVLARLLGRAGAAMDLVTDACVLVLDPAGEHELTREFVQQSASTARQLRILKAQGLINGGRDFLSRLFPGPASDGPETGMRPPVAGAERGAGRPAPAAQAATPASLRPPAGLNSCTIPREPSPADSPTDNWP